LDHGYHQELALAVELPSTGASLPAIPGLLRELKRQVEHVPSPSPEFTTEVGPRTRSRSGSCPYPMAERLVQARVLGALTSRRLPPADIDEQD
jgi:hypothetical protein